MREARPRTALDGLAAAAFVCVLTFAPVLTVAATTDPASTAVGCLPWLSLRRRVR